MLIKCIWCECQINMDSDCYAKMSIGVLSCLNKKCFPCVVHLNVYLSPFLFLDSGSATNIWLHCDFSNNICVIVFLFRLVGGGGGT